MSLEKVYFVISTRNHQSGEISYQLSDNLSPRIRGARKVTGTSTCNPRLARRRLQQCQSGKWWGYQRKEEARRAKEDDRYRKSLHKAYLRTL